MCLVTFPFMISSCPVLFWNFLPHVSAACPSLVCFPASSFPFLIVYTCFPLACVFIVCICLCPVPVCQVFSQRATAFIVTTRSFQVSYFHVLVFLFSALFVFFLKWLNFLFRYFDYVFPLRRAFVCTLVSRCDLWFCLVRVIFCLDFL